MSAVTATPSTLDTALVDRQQILAIVERYLASIDSADTVLAQQIWCTTDDASLVHPRGTDRGWADVRDRFYGATMGATFSSRRLSARDVAIHLAGDAAWLTFEWDFAAVVREDGSPLRTSGRETQVLRRTREGWRIAHVHYSGMPVTAAREGY